MLITEFMKQLDEINSSTSAVRDKCINSRIQKKYIPVLDKREKMSEIIKLSIVDDEKGRYIDPIINEVFFVYTMITSYTDLTVPEEDGKSSPYVMYDILRSTGIDEEIFPRIGKDLLEYRYMNEQMVALWEKREKRYNNEESN